ncbi:TetR family transcriptional regulator [Mycolicibacterium moriokaense]|nr:TetR family transcriptional regulator [Mycolicibacterium moriokaense]
MNDRVRRRPHRYTACIQKRRKPDPEGRRVELCDAAIQLLADHGATGLTHRKVDREAGVPDGTTSFYFRTRQALLRGVADRVAELDLADLRSATRTNGKGRASASSELAKVVMRSGTEPWRSRTRARYELLLQASRDSGLADAFDQNLDLFTQLHRDIVLRLQPPGRQPAESVIEDETLVTMMFVNGLLLSFARGDRAIRSAKELDRLLSQIVAGMTATSSSTERSLR